MQKKGQILPFRLKITEMNRKTRLDSAAPAQKAEQDVREMSPKSAESQQKAGRKRTESHRAIGFSAASTSSFSRDLQAFQEMQQLSPHSGERGATAATFSHFVFGTGAPAAFTFG